MWCGFSTRVKTYNITCVGMNSQALINASCLNCVNMLPRNGKPVLFQVGHDSRAKMRSFSALIDKQKRYISQLITIGCLFATARRLEALPASR